MAKNSVQGIPEDPMKELHHMPGLGPLKALVCTPALPRVPVCMMHFEHAKDTLQAQQSSASY